jgi:hypothetical protein
MAIKTVYDEIEIRGAKVTVKPNTPDGERGDIYATLILNNKGRHTFRKGRIVNKTNDVGEENATKVLVWPFGPTKKEILMLSDTDVPRDIKNVELQVMFYDPKKERGLNSGGKIYRVDFTGAEVEYLDYV